jgi:YidC/Oxa1 family membrane protein insertase
VRHVFYFSPGAAEKADFGFRQWFVFTNLSNAPLAVNSIEVAGAAGIVPDDNDRTFGLLKSVSGCYAGANSIKRDEIANTEFTDRREFSHNERRAVWCGFNNRFFASLLLADPRQADYSLSVKFTKLDVATEFLDAHPRWRELFHLHPEQGSVTLVTSGFSLAPQASTRRDFLYYGGPIDDDIAGQFSSVIDDITVFTWSWLKPISNLLLFILEYIAVVTKNYGWAIVLLTVVVKLALHPLTCKSIRAQKGMQKIQPLLKGIKEKYKNDPQKQQMETVRIFKENGVNPVGGCLPILLQMPIFFALYGVFARCFAIRQEPFISGWIDDLSHPDTVYMLHGVPLFGALAVNLLPLVYLALQLLHMRMMPQSDDPQMRSQQRMMKLMPVIFVFIFYNMPSGLVLYFAVQSLLSIVEYLVMKATKEDEPALTDGGMKVVDAKVIPAGEGFKKK